MGGGKGVTLVIGVVIGVMLISATDGGFDDERPSSFGKASPSASASRSNQPGDTVEMADTGAAGRQVVLTFDDGPHPTQTKEVLRILREREVNAVFCLVGEQVAEHPALVRQIVDDGHALCNHTFSHDQHLSERAVGEVTREIVSTTDAIHNAVPGADVRYFRQPATLLRPDVGAVAGSLGYRPLDWTVDTHDWIRPSADAIVRAATQDLRPGAVILLHDGGGDRSATVAALPRILDAIEAKGLTIGLP